MKKLLLLIFIWCTVGCAQENAYDFLWDANEELDMKSYKIWVWEGKDTLNIGAYYFHGEFSHDSLLIIYGENKFQLVDTYLSIENGEYLKIRGSAVDLDLNESEFSYSPAFKKDDAVKPMQMSGMGILK